MDDAHTITRDRAEERRDPGMLYRFAAMQLYASGFASVALGIARATLDAFIALARDKTPSLSQTGLRESGVVQSLIGLSDARLKAARTWLIDVLEQTQEAVKITGELTIDQRLVIRQAATYAIHQARETVNTLYHEAGATAIFDANPFERRFRDVNTVTQQVQGRRSHFETVGQHLLGAEANLRWL